MLEQKNQYSIFFDAQLHTLYGNVALENRGHWIDQIDVTLS